MDNRATCERCGYVWQVNETLENRKGLLCSSCRAAPATWVQANFYKCKAHHGDFASDQITPLQNGTAYMPGERVCKKSDCVNPHHIV